MTPDRVLDELTQPQVMLRTQLAAPLLAAQCQPRPSRWTLKSPHTF